MSRRTLRKIALLYLALGVAVGLSSGWLWQSGYAGCRLEDMAAPHKEDYARAVAEMYVLTEDVGTVYCSLPGLSDSQIASLVDVAVGGLLVAPQRDAREVAAMIHLAGRFGRGPDDLLAYAATPYLSADRTRVARGTPISEEAPETLGPPLFVLTRSQPLCTAEAGSDRAVVAVEDLDIRPLKGIRLHVSHDGYDQDLVTGLARADEPGAADFVLEKARTYVIVILDENGQAVSAEANVSADEAACPPGQRATWYIRFTKTD